MSARLAEIVSFVTVRSFGFSCFDSFLNVTLMLTRDCETDQFQHIRYSRTYKCVGVLPVTSRFSSSFYRQSQQLLLRTMSDISGLRGK